MGAHIRRGGRRGLVVRTVVVAGAAACAAVVTTGIGLGLGAGTSAAAEPAAEPAAAAAPAAGSPAPDSDVLSGLLGPTPAAPRTASGPAAPADARSAPLASPSLPVSSGSAPAAAPGPTPTPAAAPSGAALVAGTPCTVSARACVDLARRQAWLIENGAVVRGPVRVMTGDRDDPTPRGTFQVQWKAEVWTSREYLTQMPYSVFFADGGIAFHEGRQDTYSAGCVKLSHDDAVAWFTYLQVGDEVQVR